MIVNTLFSRGTSFVRGEVEVKLMPGIPQLHVVGLPDRSIRECGVRLKTALKSTGFAWPRGHQIIVNLRPSYERKESAGIDLAIALGVLGATGQLTDGVASRLNESVVYGELALDGRVFAPGDLTRALGAAGEAPVLTGQVGPALRNGRWLEFVRLDAAEAVPRVRTEAHALVRPAMPDLNLHPEAFRTLWLAAHLGLSVLVAGPQGSGKSTWARILYAASRAPDPECTRARAALFGDHAFAERWRPLECPHHSASPLAMIGGGRPLVPGILSRAHGGVLVMDEFLEFHPAVLEALREPMETGEVSLARVGSRERLPARVQLIATSNLCPCGELRPGAKPACTRPLGTCRRTSARLSGPILDRFDLLVFSHDWTTATDSAVDTEDLLPLLERLDQFAGERAAEDLAKVDPPVSGLSHRRRRAIARVARGLADFECVARVTDRHVLKAQDLVVTPIERLKRIFG